MRKLSARERRLVAVLILIAAIALGFLVIVNPILDGFRDRAQRRQQAAQTFQTNERRIASLSALQHEAEQQIEQMRGLFIAAPNADEAGETLREQIEAAAQATGVTIKATEALQASEDGGLRASLEAQMTHTQLVTLLTRLNQIKPGVVIETVTVTAEDALIHLKSDQIDVRIEASAPFVLAN